MGIFGVVDMSILNDSAMLKRVLKLQDEMSTDLQRYPTRSQKGLNERKFGITVADAFMIISVTLTVK